MAYTLQQLRGLVAVAGELHFGRAADRLRMTQPPPSRQIQKLESAVGAQLLDRDSRRVALTPVGEAFLVEARQILALADAAPNLTRRVFPGSRGVVRVGFTAASTFGVPGRLLNRVAEELPEVHLYLVEMVTREQIAALSAVGRNGGRVRPRWARRPGRWLPRHVAAAGDVRRRPAAGGHRGVLRTGDHGGALRRRGATVRRARGHALLAHSEVLPAELTDDYRGIPRRVDGVLELPH